VNLVHIDGRQRMVLLHAFMKETCQTPDSDLEIAPKNNRGHERA
jgi:phage-related protein